MRHNKSLGKESGKARDKHKRMLRLQKQKSKAHTWLRQKKIQAISSHKTQKVWNRKGKINQIPLYE